MCVNVIITDDPWADKEVSCLICFQEADPDCFHCGGTGKTVERQPTLQHTNMSNTSWRGIAQVLDLDPTEGDLTASEVAGVRKRILVAIKTGAHLSGPEGLSSEEYTDYAGRVVINLLNLALVLEAAQEIGSGVYWT